MTKYKTGADITDLKQPDFIKLLESAVEWRLTKIGRFKVMRGAEYQDLEPEPLEFIIEHLLPLNFNALLGGETGASKSYFSMQKAMCIANNEDSFLGFKILKKNLRVLYIDTECGEQIMHNRYKALIKNFKPWVGGDRFIMISMEGDSENLWDDIDEAVSIFKPDYVCVDCLFNINQWGGDLGKAPDMKKITDAMQKIRSRHKTTVEAIAHFVKGNSERGLDMNRIAGSAVLQNWVQHCLCIINVPADKSLRFMQITKARTSDYPRDVFALEWHSKEQWLSKRAIVADPIKYLMSQDKIDKMYALITNVKERADKDGFFTTEMALNAGAELEISRATVHRQLTSAVTAGLITDEGHGKWRLTGLRTIEFDNYESDEE